MVSYNEHTTLHHHRSTSGATARGGRLIHGKGPSVVLPQVSCAAISLVLSSVVNDFR